MRHTPPELAVSDTRRASSRRASNDSPTSAAAVGFNGPKFANGFRRSIVVGVVGSVLGCGATGTATAFAGGANALANRTTTQDQDNGTSSGVADQLRPLNHERLG